MIVPLILEGVERLVLYIPSGLASSHQVEYVFFADLDIRDPAEPGDLLILGDLPIFEHVNELKFRLELLLVNSRLYRTTKTKNKICPLFSAYFQRRCQD